METKYLCQHIKQITPSTAYSALLQRRIVYPQEHLWHILKILSMLYIKEKTMHVLNFCIKIKLSFDFSCQELIEVFSHYNPRIEAGGA